MGAGGAMLYVMAMGSRQERDSELLGLIRCVGSSLGDYRFRGAVVPVIQTDMVMAVDSIAVSRCRYIDRFMLVGIAAIAVQPFPTRGDVDDTDCGGIGDHRGDNGALLEIRDEHDGSGNADRAA